MRPLKPALSYLEQIHHLSEDHGLIIEDATEATAILSTVNYYRLSAYGIGLISNEKYQNGTSLQTLYSLYRFDAHLRYLLLPVIEEIEIDVRTKMAYHLAITYGPESYKDRSLFSRKKNKFGESIYDIFMGKVRKEIETQREVPFVKHHICEYDGHFPVWVIVEVFTFGMLSMLYSIMNPPDKIKIAKEFGVSSAYLESWLITLVEI